MQAAIAACHARARVAEETDWARIASLYERLAQLTPSPVVELNRAVAVGMAYGPAAGLELADKLLTDPVLEEYHLLPGGPGRPAQPSWAGMRRPGASSSVRPR